MRPMLGPACPNLSKMRSRASSGMGAPVLPIDSRTVPSVAAPDTAMRPPAGVPAPPPPVPGGGGPRRGVAPAGGGGGEGVAEHVVDDGGKKAGAGKPARAMIDVARDPYAARARHVHALSDERLDQLGHRR